ncbi:MAG: hypothetical protein ABI995_03795 [Acidobacteriota bacterium]
MKYLPILAMLVIAGGCVRSRATQIYPCATSEALAKAAMVKPGMTRGDLLKIFTIQGGISNRLERTYICAIVLTSRQDSNSRLLADLHRARLDSQWI